MNDSVGDVPTGGAPPADGRVALITGGGQGLGRAVALRLARAGRRIVVGDINAEKAEAVCQELIQVGATARSSVFDVADETAVEQAVSSVVEDWGRIDILVNSAAIFSTIEVKPFEQIGLAEWESVMRVNVTGTFLCCRAVARHMRAAGFGRIINLSSATVLMGRPNYLHYVTSKSAAIGMTRAMARELGDSGITVNAVMPGATPTEVPRDTINPRSLEQIVAEQAIHEVLTPEDIAEAIAFIADDSTRLMTGQIMVVDGGHYFI